MSLSSSDMDGSYFIVYLRQIAWPGSMNGILKLCGDLKMGVKQVSVPLQNAIFIDLAQSNGVWGSERDKAEVSENCSVGLLALWFTLTDF